MFAVVFGIHKFGTKKYAYKSAHCPTCNAPRIFLQWRWFGWFHLFIVPLIPMGYDFKWSCSQCQTELKSAKETSLPLKLLLAWLYCLVGSVILFSQHFQFTQVWLLSLRLIFIGGLGYIIYSVVCHWQNVAAKEGQSVLPLDDLKSCKVCSGPLAATPRLQCQQCKLRVIHSAEQLPAPVLKLRGWHWLLIQHHGLFSAGGAVDPQHRGKGRTMMIAGALSGLAGAVLQANSTPGVDIFSIFAWMAIVFGIIRFGQGASQYFSGT